MSTAPTWFRCSTHASSNPTLNILARSAEEAKTKYLGRVGIIESLHAVEVIALGSNYKPSEVDLRQNGLAA